MNKKILLLLPALALMLGACQGKVTPSGSSDDGSSGQTETVTGVELDHETLSLQVGNTSQLSASVKPISLSNREVNWSSDHPEFASVDASGMVTAVAAGVAHIRATADADPTKYAECVVTVTQRMVTVVMEDLDDILAATDTLKFGCYQGNNEKYYYFKGSVDSNTRGEVSDSWEEGVAVKLEAASTTGKYLMSFGTGESKQYFEMSDDHHFAVVSTPTSGREWDWDATWHTVKRTISGTTYYPGTYQTFSTISGCNASQVADDFLFQFVYQVEPFGPESINLSIPQDALYVNDYVEVAAELLPLGAEGDLVWSVSGDEHVTIDQEGKLTADGDATVGGTVTVTAKYGAGDDEVSATLNVSVEAALNYGTQAAPLSIDAATALLQKQSPSHKDMYVSGIATSNDAYGSQYKNWGDYIKLANDAGSQADVFSFYRAKAGENTGYETTYAEAGSMVGKRILAKGKGEIYSGKPQLSSGGVLLNIEDAGVEPASVTISPAGDFELVKGGSKQLSASVAPVTAPQTITWTVTPVDEAVAAHCTVVNGLVALTDDAVTGEQFTIKAASAKAGVEATAVVTVIEEKDEFVIDKTSIGLVVASGVYNTTATDFTIKGKAFSANNGVGLSATQGSGKGDAYYEMGLLQFNKADDTSKTPTRLRGAITNSEALVAKSVTILWYSTYSSQAQKYLPTVKAGTAADSLAVVSANETGTVSGTKTSMKQYSSSKDYDVYEYTTTYTLASGSCFFSFEGGESATYVKSITLEF